MSKLMEERIKNIKASVERTKATIERINKMKETKKA